MLQLRPFRTPLSRGGSKEKNLVVQLETLTETLRSEVMDQPRRWLWPHSGATTTAFTSARPRTLTASPSTRSSWRRLGSRAWSNRPSSTRPPPPPCSSGLCRPLTLEVSQLTPTLSSIKTPRVTGSQQRDESGQQVRQCLFQGRLKYWRKHTISRRYFWRRLHFGGPFPQNHLWPQIWIKEQGRLLWVEFRTENHDAKTRPASASSLENWSVWCG